MWIPNGIETTLLPWVEVISNHFHENKVVQPKFDQTKNKTLSLTVVGIINRNGVTRASPHQPCANYSPECSVGTVGFPDGFYQYSHNIFVPALLDVHCLSDSMDPSGLRGIVAILSEAFRPHCHTQAGLVSRTVAPFNHPSYDGLSCLVNIEFERRKLDRFNSDMAPRLCVSEVSTEAQTLINSPMSAIGP